MPVAPCKPGAAFCGKNAMRVSRPAVSKGLSRSARAGMQLLTLDAQLPVAQLPDAQLPNEQAHTTGCQLPAAPKPVASQAANNTLNFIQMLH